jgi:hypothetical protein
VVGSRSTEDLVHADTMQPSTRGFVSMPIRSFGKSHHTAQKTLTSKDPFAQFLLERDQWFGIQQEARTIHPLRWTSSSSPLVKRS